MLIMRKICVGINYDSNYEVEFHILSNGEKSQVVCEAIKAQLDLQNAVILKVLAGSVILGLKFESSITPRLALNDWDPPAEGSWNYLAKKFATDKVILRKMV